MQEGPKTDRERDTHRNEAINNVRNPAIIFHIQKYAQKSRSEIIDMLLTTTNPMANQIEEERSAENNKKSSTNRI